MNYKRLFPNKQKRLALLNSLGFIPDKPMITLLYYIRTGKIMNWKNPQTYTEKLQWLKYYDRNPIYTEMVDKYKMKEFVTNRVGEGHIVPLLGCWECFDEIDFDQLPDSFVLKCNHDSGSVIICESKAEFDVEDAKKKLTSALSKDAYSFGREWPYKNVPRRIIAEKYLGAESNEMGFCLLDYKFFCFNGEPKVMYISNDKGNDPRTDFFDMDFHHLPIRMKDPNADVPPKKPKEFETMRELAKELSGGIPHLRVDFYVTNGSVYVGELTFFHNSGFTPIWPDEWNKKMGDWIELPQWHVISDD